MSNERKFSKEFYDVEHDGDIQQALEPIYAVGGNVTHREFNYDAETLEIAYTIPEDKIEAFKKARKDNFYWS